MAGGQQQQSIDLSVLSLEQLNQMKTQHEEEVQTLSGNFAKLRDAQVCLYVCMIQQNSTSCPATTWLISVRFRSCRGRRMYFHFFNNGARVSALVSLRDVRAVEYGTECAVYIHLF